VIKVFADAWFYLALLDTSDQFHRKAAAWLRSFDGSIVTTRWVLVEVANSFSPQPFRRHFSALLAGLEADASVKIVGESDRLFQQGRILYDQRPDKEWSLTDCISFVVMEEEGLREALTGDRHFAQAGFVAVFAE
jgi:predicted nucleic acid-binding protein